MGVFDTVKVKCPLCGHENHWQSKMGDPCMNHYTLENAPVSVIHDLSDFCSGCKKPLKIVPVVKPEYIVVEDK